MHQGGKDMIDGLDVIIVDDEPYVCDIIAEMVKRFYSWGSIHAFTDVDQATDYCLRRESGISIFVVDVFLSGKSGFFFLDSVANKFDSVYEDTVMITGNASDDVVNMCVASDVNHLLEKPVKPYALQLAIRSIVSKYMNFSKRLLQDPAFAQYVAMI
jgi:response regulator of citrate/malate metabolism